MKTLIAGTLAIGACAVTALVLAAPAQAQPPIATGGLTTAAQATTGNGGALTGAASADTRSGTPHGRYWYIGTGDAYGEVVWLDHAVNSNLDRDELILKDDTLPPGYSVRMTVVHDSFKKTVHAYSGNNAYVLIPRFYKGEKAKFKACAWDNGEVVGGSCRPWTTITE